MPTLQEQYDEAMYAYSKGELQGCIERLRALLAQDPTYFDAQLSLGMACYHQGNYEAAIQEGHKAEQMNPKDQLVHTNLSLFYLKAGNKSKAEHHGAQARIASWRNAPAGPGESASDSLDMAPPSAPSPGAAAPTHFPDMPWKRKSDPKDS